MKGGRGVGGGEGGMVEVGEVSTLSLPPSALTKESAVIDKKADERQQNVRGARVCVRACACARTLQAIREVWTFCFLSADGQRWRERSVNNWATPHDYMNNRRALWQSRLTTQPTKCKYASWLSFSPSCPFYITHCFKNNRFWNYWSNSSQMKPDNLVECKWRNIQITSSTFFQIKHQLENKSLKVLNKKRKKEWKWVVMEMKSDEDYTEPKASTTSSLNVVIILLSHRCTYRGQVWDPSASLVKISPGGLWFEGRRLMVVHQTPALVSDWTDMLATGFDLWRQRLELAPDNRCLTAISPTVFYPPYQSLSTYQSHLPIQNQKNCMQIKLTQIFFLNNHNKY